MKLTAEAYHPCLTLPHKLLKHIIQYKPIQCGYQAYCLSFIFGQAVTVTTLQAIPRTCNAFIINAAVRYFLRDKNCRNIFLQISFGS